MIMETPFNKNDLMAMLDSVEDAVVKLDGDAKYVAMNMAAADIFRRLGKDPQGRWLGNRCGNYFQTSKAASSSGNSARPLKIMWLSNSSFSIPATSIGTKYRGTPLILE